MDRYRRKQKQNKGSLTVEASLIVVIFMAAFIALLSIINMIRAQVVIQNAANQAAKEIAQYTYILQKAGLADLGTGNAEKAGQFADDTQEMIGTIFTFFDASEHGLDTAVETYKSNLERAKNYPGDISQRVSEIETDIKSLKNEAESVKAAAEEMESAVSDYFKDPKEIFMGLLAVMKDSALDAVKISVATPVCKNLTNKYLGVYPDDYLERLGVVGGTAGINYWGSSILLDFQSIEVSASYKMKVELPFFDKLEYQFKTTASTRAWIGDGSHNENGKKGASSDDGRKEVRGSKLNDKATDLPGVRPGDSEQSNLDILRAEFVALYGEEAGKLIDQFGWDAASIMQKYGENGFLVLSTYQKDAVDIIKTYGDDGFNALYTHGDQAITLIKKYQNQGMEIIRIFNSYSGSTIDLNMVMDAINHYGQSYVDMVNHCGIDGMLLIVTSEQSYADGLMSYYDSYGDTYFNRLLKADSATVKSKYEKFGLDGLKIAGWNFPPKDIYYEQYKAVYDNEKYYDQLTGAVKYPPMDGFEGESVSYEIPVGTMIDRYSYQKPDQDPSQCKDTGRYFSPAGIPYEQRALPPDQQGGYYTVYKVVKPIPCRMGDIAPWFDAPGGGTQYMTSMTVKDLIDKKYIKVEEIQYGSQDERTD